MPGFLLGEKDNNFAVLTLSLNEETYSRSNPETANHPTARFEVGDLKTGAAAFLKKLRAPKEDRFDSRPWWIVHLEARSEAFVFAWACWRNGLDDLAAELFDEAVNMPKGFGPFPNKPPTQPLEELVADGLAYAELRKAGKAFGPQFYGEAAVSAQVAGVSVLNTSSNTIPTMSIVRTPGRPLRSSSKCSKKTPIMAK